MTRYIIYFLSLHQIQSILDVANKIEKNGDLEGASYLREHLDEDIMQCMVDVLKVTPSPDQFPTSSSIFPYFIFHPTNWHWTGNIHISNHVITVSWLILVFIFAYLSPFNVYSIN